MPVGSIRRSPIARLLRGCVRAAILTLAGMLVLQVLFALGPVHAWMWRLAMPRSTLEHRTPSTIVVLGGAGIPSGSGLVRTYHAAHLAKAWPQAAVIVALPTDGDPDRSSVGRMRDELVMRGVPAASVRMETRGRNTYEQALNIRAMLGDGALDELMVIVSSPTHLRRAIACFRRQGFTDVTCYSAGDVGADADLGGGSYWRYGFWGNLETSIEVARELLALLVYKLRGWA